MLPKLKLGVAGLGRAFAVMLPTLVRDPRIALVAAADPRAEARAQFEADFQCKVYREVADLCADPNVEAVYIATPHQFHAAQACMALAAGKHVLVEKPMALSLDECRSDDRCSAQIQQATGRRSQPQLRPADPPHEEAHRQRQVRRACA